MKLRNSIMALHKSIMEPHDSINDCLIIFILVETDKVQ